MSRIIIFGAGGFIGTNLAIRLAEDKGNSVTLVDRKLDYLDEIKKYNFTNMEMKVSGFDIYTDFDKLLAEQDVVYHLESTTVPTTSNLHISQELMANVVVTSAMLDSCVKNGVSKVVFVSSGGTVYGLEGECPLKEDTITNPISSYGIQKLTIEKLLYLYNYLHGIDYRIVRLSNPYGPYQRPNGILGAVTTFTYKALKNEAISIYGDGSIVRDFIYIDDVIKSILNVVDYSGKYKLFNIGSGKGTSLKQVLFTIEKSLEVNLSIKYLESRKVDVPVNYLDVSRYEKVFGYRLEEVTLEEGIIKTADFIKKRINM